MAGSTPLDPSSLAAPEDDRRLVEALRAGDERAFTELLERYHSTLVRLAMIYVADRAVAEEVVQETWLGVLQGIDRFEGRASLKTWIVRILLNRARTRRHREARSIPFSAFWNPEGDPGEPAVEPERFLPADHLKWPHHWNEFPDSWSGLEERLVAQETYAYIRQVIEALPPHQREVITLRDIEGWTAGEVCAALGISEGNQRVLLHRARSRVRRALEQYLSEQ
uniref:Sigma-70 family RNA polymerase sigma factor n=2 Tax=Thermorudis TaxID=1649508 RepID=A0A7C3APP9_9BACT